MTPEIIRETLARLRDAGTTLRRRPALEVVEALAGVLEAWRDPGSPWHRQLVHELPEAAGFSRPMVEEGLRHGLAPFNGEALRQLVERELGGPGALDGDGPVLVSGFETTAVLLAGSLPTPTLVALLAPLVLRSPVLAKTASQDPLTARLFRRSLESVDVDLAACLEVVTFPGRDAERTAALLDADCVVASGSDETVSAVAARVRPPRRLVGYGHRVSVAALGPEATGGSRLQDAARGLAHDVALWDQLGCLSPLAVYAAGPASAAERVADSLASALEDAERRWPRGGVEVAAAELGARERAEAEMRSAGGHSVRVLAGSGARWTVVREADARFRPAPLHRFVRVHPVEDAAALMEALRPLAAHLAGVAVAGFGRGASGLRRQLAQLGASRVCSPGTLQSPPLSWHRDNRGVLLPLARSTDLS